MTTVVKKALGIDHYWGRVEFASGMGAIHLHIIGIARGKAYLWAFYQARTSEKKAEVLDKYAQKNLDMTADVNVNDNPQQKPDYESSPLGKRYCKCNDHIEDVRRLAEDCMCHQFNTTAYNQTRQILQEHVEYILEQSQHLVKWTQKDFQTCQSQE